MSAPWSGVRFVAPTPARGLRVGQWVVLAREYVNLRTRAVTVCRPRVSWDELRGRVVEAATGECPMVTVRWEDGSLSTLLPGNLYRVRGEREGIRGER